MDATLQDMTRALDNVLSEIAAMRGELRSIERAVREDLHSIADTSTFVERARRDAYRRVRDQERKYRYINPWWS